MTVHFKVALVLSVVLSVTAFAPRQSAAGSNPGDLSRCPKTLIDGAARYNSVVGHFGRKCYTLETTTKETWQHAEESCATFGGSLVHIENDQEQTFVQSFVQRHSADSSPVWLGLHDRIIEGSYMWIDSPVPGYTHFDPNHMQNGAADVNDCVVMKPDGFWQDVKCGYRNPLAGFVDSGELHPVMCQYDVIALGVLGAIGK